MRSKTAEKLVSIFIAVLFLFTHIVDDLNSVSAVTNSVTAEVVPSADSMYIGEQVTVTISIDMTGVYPPDDALGSFTSTLSWDPTILTYNNNSGLLAGFTGVINTGSAGSGLITFNGANTSGVTGEFIVLTITFDVISAGISVLDLGFSAMAAAATFADLLVILTITDGSFTALCKIYLPLIVNGSE